jgi:hypothetical protein
MISKSLLHWSKRSTNDTQAKSTDTKTSDAKTSDSKTSVAKASVARSSDAKAKVSNAQAKMSVSDRVDFTDPEDGSCCWPALGVSESFESRWRALLKLERD